MVHHRRKKTHDFGYGKFLMVSSPRKDLIADFVKENCMKFYMPVWTENEIINCHELMYTDIISLDLVKKIFILCEFMLKAAMSSVDIDIIDDVGEFGVGDDHSHKIIYI